MVQNHLMQLLALVAMEPPIAFTADGVRDRKMDALLSVQPLVDETGGHDRTSCGRSTASGWVAGGEVPGYRQEPGVSPESTTETFVALRMQLDSWRWAGVPFYLRTGKRLPKRTTEIAIQFRRPPLQIFKRVSPTSVAPNLLIINVQPDEGISVRFEAKLPGHAHAARAGDDELPLRHRIRRIRARSLRDAAARRDARRSDAVRAPRFRRSARGR